MKEKIEHRLMRLIKERGYEPEIYRGEDDYWMVTFLYGNDSETHCITKESLICDQWWLV